MSVEQKPVDSNVSIDRDHFRELYERAMSISNELAERRRNRTSPEAQDDVHHANHPAGSMPFIQYRYAVNFNYSIFNGVTKTPAGLLELKTTPEDKKHQMNIPLVRRMIDHEQQPTRPDRHQ